MLKQAVVINNIDEDPPQTTASSATQQLALLTFKVDQQLYGLPVTSVVRIIEMVTLTRLPDAPEIIEGIINLHGKAVPVMDLHRRFGLPQPDYRLHTPIILVDIEGGNHTTMGLIVDTVEQVLDVPYKDLEMAETIVPAELAGQMAARAAYLAGVAKIDRQMILVLNVQALLRPAEQLELAEVLDKEEVNSFRETE